MEDGGGATGEMMEQLQEDDAKEDAGVVNNAEFSSSTSKSSVFLNAACAITNTTPNSQSAVPPEYSPSRGSRTTARSSPLLPRSSPLPARSKRRGRLPFFFFNSTSGSSRRKTMKTMSEIGCQSRLRNRIRNHDGILHLEVGDARSDPKASENEEGKFE
ncbi:hypothetical protein ACFX13_014552 [Malus domestica]